MATKKEFEESAPTPAPSFEDVIRKMRAEFDAKLASVSAENEKLRAELSTLGSKTERLNAVREAVSAGSGEADAFARIGLDILRERGAPRCFVRARRSPVLMRDGRTFDDPMHEIHGDPVPMWNSTPTPESPDLEVCAVPEERWPDLVGRAYSAAAKRKELAIKREADQEKAARAALLRRKARSGRTASFLPG